MDENDKKTEKSKICPQIIAGFIANLSFLACGFAFAWTTPSLPKIEDKFSDTFATSDQGAWIVTGLPIGACVGPILSGFLLDIIGRKWFLYLTGVPFVAGWVVTFIAQKWWHILLARLIVGVSVGAVFAMGPIYLGEISEPRIRGANSAMSALLLNLGFVIVYAVGPILDRKMLALVCLAPTIVFLLTFLWMPESPYYCMKKKNEKAATMSLIWLRNKLDNTDELAVMSDHLQKTEDHERSFKELFTLRSNRKAMGILLLTLGAQQLSGLLAIQAYASFLLQKMHLPISSNLALVIIGLVCLVSGLASAFVVDRFGRKPLLGVSGYGVTLCLAVVGAYFYIESKGIKVSSISFVPLVGIVLYFVLFSIGLVSIPSILNSEIFPVNVKTWATMLTNIYGSLLGLIVGKCYQLVVEAWGYHVIFFTFGVLVFIMTTAAIVVMPETSRKSLEEIQECLKKTNKDPTCEPEAECPEA